MRLIISNNATIPIYEQIKNQIIEAILDGSLTENEALPSIRQLAKDLKVSVITTTRAYRELEAEGYIATVHGKGSYVLGKNPLIQEEYLLQNIESNYLKILELQQTLGLDDEALNEIFEVIKKEYKHDRRN